ncbi:MAG: hypothetical protein ACHQ4H_05035, partial [Ktedonobacterales bacterium]
MGSVAADAAPRSHLEALPATHVARSHATGRPVPRLLSCFRPGLTTIVQALIASHTLPRGHFDPAPW